MNHDKAKEMQAEADAAESVNAVKRYRVRHAWTTSLSYADIEVNARTLEEAIAESNRIAAEDPDSYFNASTYDDGSGPTFIDTVEVIDEDDDTPLPSRDYEWVPIEQREAAATHAHAPSVIVCEADGKPAQIGLAALLIEYGSAIADRALGEPAHMLRVLGRGDLYALWTQDKKCLFWAYLTNAYNGPMPIRDFQHGVDIWADQEAMF